MTKLDTIYRMVNQRTGINRIRDVRLERIAADRALEARYQVGVDGSTAIVHPTNQLIARTWPLHVDVHRHVGEVATWHYYPPSWVDPIRAIVDGTLADGPNAGDKVGWWNSPVHKAVLMDPDFTHFGFGLHREEHPPDAPRWYAIGVLAGRLTTPIVRLTELFGPRIRGRHFRADGGTIGSKAVDVESTVVHVDDRWLHPDGAPRLHMVDGPLATYWIPEGDRAMLVEP